MTLKNAKKKYAKNKKYAKMLKKSCLRDTIK